MPDLVRASYYAREHKKSIALTQDFIKRGDIRSAQAWLAIAQGESEMVEFWRSYDAPDMEYLKPGFML